MSKMILTDTPSLPSRSGDDSRSGRRSLRKRESKTYVEDNFDHILSNGDVEMESDEDDDGPHEPLPLPKELPKKVLEEKTALIRQLKMQLSNEEMSLVLLKKIRNSQDLAKEAKEAAAKASVVGVTKPQGASTGINSVAGSSVNNANSRNQSSHHRSTPPPSSQMKTGSRPVNSNTGLVGAAGLGANSSRSSGAAHSGHMKNVLSPDLSNLKPVGVDPKSLTAGLPANLGNLKSKGGYGATKLTEVSKTPKMDAESWPKNKAAAKLALRKQLEKTLLEIAPPKPPPPEMHFIPNSTSTEFLCLMGLEECVTKILNEDKENSIPAVPFSCSLCGTDFTQTWKWNEDSESKEVEVVCENCVSTNVKKALKAEHTKSLKAAFVKALQQEQELEAHMAAQSAREAAASQAAASAAATASASINTTNSMSQSSAARIASPDSRSRNSVDVTVRPVGSSQSRSIPSAHQQAPSRSVPGSSGSSAATVERAPYQRSSSTQHLPSSQRAQPQDHHNRKATSNNTGGRGCDRGSQSYNNGGLPSSKSATDRSSSSKNDLTNANAMAQQVAALMSMGGYGNDPAAMALQAAAIQQQLLMYGGSGTTNSNSSTTSSTTSRSSSSNHTASSRTSAAAAAAAAAQAASAASSNDVNSQLAAMSQLLNPMTMYNYQAMAAMMAAMGGGSSASGAGNSASSGGSSSSGKGAASSNAGGSGSSSSSATNQMMELQRQAEHLQRQYLLDMIPPGTLGQSWGKK